MIGYVLSMWDFKRGLRNGDPVPAGAFGVIGRHVLVRSRLVHLSCGIAPHVKPLIPSPPIPQVKPL